MIETISHSNTLISNPVSKVDANGDNNNLGSAHDLTKLSNGANRVNDIFNTYTEEYDKWFERNHFAYLSELEAVRKLMPRIKYGVSGLEIGVGTGRFADPLGVTVGLDPSEKMLRIARHRGIRTVLAKGERIPFKDKAFDFLLLIVTLCYVNKPYLIITEARRVLKDRGKIIIGIIDKQSFLGKIYQDKKEESRFYRESLFYSPEEVIELLKGYNFNEFTTFQTVSLSPGQIKGIEQPQEGYGKGGFVVMSAEKL